MREVGFCDRCMRESDYCYGKKAEEIAYDPKKTPIQKNNEISKNRDKAREDLCSQVNSDKLNPDFKGKEKL